MYHQQICLSNATYMSITSYADIRQLCQYICLISTQCNQQCDQKHRYTYISHYWNMPLNIYVCHITHVCTTSLVLYSICRSNITAYTSAKTNKIYATLFAKLYPYMCQQKIYPSNATYVNHFMDRCKTTVSAYIYISNELRAMNNETRNTYMNSPHYWHMSLNSKPITHHVTLHFYCSLHIDPTLLCTSNKNQWTDTFIYHTNAN